MRKVLIATHGTMASGIRNTLELFIGCNYQIDVIDAYLDDNNEDYTSRIQKFITDLDVVDEGFIFTDLIGGSVNQKIMQEIIETLDSKIIHLISNTNMPIILSVLLHSGDLNAQEIDRLIGETTIERIDLNKTEVQLDDKDFFE